MAGVRERLLNVSSCQAEPPKKQSNWRKKHEDFIATIRAAKTVTQVMKDGGPLPPPPPPTYDPGNMHLYSKWLYPRNKQTEKVDHRQTHHGASSNLHVYVHQAKMIVSIYRIYLIVLDLQ